MRFTCDLFLWVSPVWRKPPSREGQDVTQDSDHNGSHKQKWARAACGGGVCGGLGRYLAFVAIGVLTASVGETQYSVFLRGDVDNLIGSVVVNAFYLTAIYFMFLALRAALGQGFRPMLAITIISGVAGLMIEWFLIGNSPWGNPDALQSAMFAFWACMAAVPAILLERDNSLRPLKHRILAFAAVYTCVAAAGQGIANPELHFAFHIWSVVFGYIGLMVLCLVGYGRLYRAGQNLPGAGA